MSAGGAVTVSALTDLTVTATANPTQAVAEEGTTVALPVIIATTEAFIDGSASVTTSDSIDVNAQTLSVIAATAHSTSEGAVDNPDTLADLQIATPAGPQTDAAAIAAITLTSITRAYVTTSGTLNSSGDVSIFASSNHDLDAFADATPTANLDANGFAVAVNLTGIQDEAFIDGSPTINAPTLHVETGGGSTFNALALSGAAGIGDANPELMAGAIALNTGLNLSHAYIAEHATLSVLPSTDITIAATTPRRST